MFADKCQGITITPSIAGHTLGGTVWRVRKDTEDIVYAVHFNHKKDRHLNGTTLDSISRPSLLITDSQNSLTVQSTRKHRDSDLLDSLLATLRKDGNVLIPVDSSARMLEISFLLDQMWSHHQLPYPLLLLTTQARTTVEFAKSMLEWMGDAAATQFAATRETPFDFKHVKLCQNTAALEKYSSPKVILASLDSMDCGFARDLFLASASYKQNLVVLTSRGYPSSLKRMLVDSTTSAKSKKLTELDVVVKRRIPLEGAELFAYRQAELEKAERLRTELAMKERKQRILEGEDEDNVSEMDIDDLDQQLMFIGDKYDHFNRDTKTTGLSFFANDSRTAMFPCIENRKTVDDYGEIIDHSQYTTADTEPVPDMIKMDADEEHEAEQESDEEEIPSKPIVHSLKLQIQCELKYIDFEGLSDGKGVKTILQRVNPKKLIIVNGTEESTKHLIKFCQESQSITNEVYAPLVEESVNVSSASNVYQVKLTDALLSSLAVTKLGEHELSYVCGRIVYDEGVTNGTDAEVEAQLATAIPSLDILTAERSSGHPSMVIGDTRLTELKRLLQIEGYQADFDRGCLIVGEDREYRIQKTSNSSLEVEGPYSRDYFRIRTLLYRMHAVL